MIGSATGRALTNSSGLESFSSVRISNASSSKSGLNLATEAKMRNAANEKKQSAPYSWKTSVIIQYLASPATPNRQKASSCDLTNEDGGCYVPGNLHYIFALAALTHTAKDHAQWRHGLRARHFSLWTEPFDLETPGGAILAGEVSGRDAAQTKAAKLIGSERSEKAAWPPITAPV
jgi:hypothetical protein